MAEEDEQAAIPPSSAGGKVWTPLDSARHCRFTLQDKVLSLGVPKTACLSPQMFKEIEAKAKIRASRKGDPLNYEYAMSFRRHRNRVQTARAMVDSSSPYVSKSLYMNKKYECRVRDFARIQKENTIMLRKIADIIQGKGTVDNRMKKKVYPNNKGPARQMKLLKLTFENLSLLKRIQSQKATYSRKQQLTDYQRMEEIMKHLSYYPLFWQLSKECQFGPFEAKARENALYRPRPRVYLNLGNSSEYYGKVFIELYASECPLTAENFRGLCTGEYGPSYRCSTIHKIFPDILWQGGEIFGAKSIYGDSFPDENFRIRHNQKGIVTMANVGPNTNGSQFIITAKKLPVLDGANVAFGRVVGGYGVLEKLCKLLTSSGKPKKKFFIIDCGETDPDDDAGNDEEEDYREEEDEEEGEGDEGPERKTLTAVSEPTTVTTDNEDSKPTSAALPAPTPDPPVATPDYVKTGDGTEEEETDEQTEEETAEGEPEEDG